MKRAQALTAFLVGIMLAGCAGVPAPHGAAPATDPAAQRALMQGILDYESGLYDSAEAALRGALAAGLAAPYERAAAHKLLAFVTCTSDRSAECEAQFRAALSADPAFVLTPQEAGHPMWAPVYERSRMPPSPAQ